MRATPGSTLGRMGERPKDVLERLLAGGRSQAFERAVGDQVPLVNDHHAVADLLHHVQHVGAVEHRFSLGGQGGEEVLDQDRGVDVQPRERLIQQDQVRVVQQGGRDQDLLPHALGIGVQPAGAVGRQAEGLEDVADAGLERILGHLVQAPAKLQELLPGEALEQGGGLGHVADPLLHVHGPLRQREAGHGNRPGVRRENAGDDLDGGALARAVGPQQAHDLACAQGERDVVQHLPGAVGEAYALERHYGLARRGGRGLGVAPGVHGGLGQNVF